MEIELNVRIGSTRVGVPYLSVHLTHHPPAPSSSSSVRPKSATTSPSAPMACPLAVAVSASVATPTSSPRRAASAIAPPRGSLRFLPPCRGARAAPLLRAGSRPRGASVVCGAQGQDTVIQVPDVTKSTWQSLVVESELPVLVEFWASWCGPCKMIDPVIGKLSKEYEGKLKCYKLNTDGNPDIATQFGIRSIPTMMIFKNGEKKDTVIGAVPESTLVACIDKYVER